MALQYLSKQGDVLDEIAFNNYGDCTSDTLTDMLAANPGLAALGPVLPAGVTITLPDSVTTTTSTSSATSAGVALWD